MKDITHIKIYVESGYGPSDSAYTELIAISPDSIRYTRNMSNASRKWSYKTDNPVFEQLFHDVATTVESFLSLPDEPFAMDAGIITFVVTYSDKTRKRQDFFLPKTTFMECFSIISHMVPECERNIMR